MNAAERLHLVSLIKDAGFWDVADNVASFIPVVGSLKDAGKGIYHAATGQYGKALGDFAWAGTGLIPGGSFARGGAKLMGTAGAKALGMGMRHAGMVGQGLRAGAMAGIGTAGDIAGGMMQPQGPPAAPPVVPQPVPQQPATSPWDSPMGPGFEMPNRPQFRFPQPTAGMQPSMFGGGGVGQMSGQPVMGMQRGPAQPFNYSGLLRSFAGNGFGTA